MSESPSARVVVSDIAQAAFGGLLTVWAVWELAQWADRRQAELDKINRVKSR